MKEDNPYGSTPWLCRGQDVYKRQAQALSGVPGNWDILTVHPHMQGAVVEGA